MKLFNKPLGEITIDDINTLIQGGVSESRTLDYKLELHTATDGGNKEFLRDISAFSNTMGGCLIYGIEEDEGVPKSIHGVEVDDFDKLKLHCENLLRSGVDPVIRGVDFRVIDSVDNKKIVIIEVPRSISRPHVVKIKKHFKFYGRNSGGVHQLEVNDLRRVFLASETLATKIRDFRNDRLSRIATGETPLPLCVGAKIVLHVIPEPAFELGEKHNFGIASYEDFPPICITGLDYHCKINFDGLVTYFSFEMPAYSYVQVFNEGIIEAVEGMTLQQKEDNKIPSVALEIRLVNALDKYLESFVKHEIDFPVWVCLSLLGVRGYQILPPQGVWFRDVTTRDSIDRDELIIQEIQVLNTGTAGEYILKPAFDSIWNACGFEGSQNYNEDDTWILTK